MVKVYFANLQWQCCACTVFSLLVRWVDIMLYLKIETEEDHKITELTGCNLTSDEST